MIEFENLSTLGRGKYILVKKQMRVPPSHSQFKEGEKKLVWINMGRIEMSSFGDYQYFEPENNVLNPCLSDKNLEALKIKIKNHIT